MFTGQGMRPQFRPGGNRVWGGVVTCATSGGGRGAGTGPVAHGAPAVARRHSGGARRIGGGGASAEKKYSLTLSLNFQNLLNNVNLSTPNGNLSSSTFGQSLGLSGGFGGFGGGGGGGAGAGNRKVTAQVRFNF